MGTQDEQGTHGRGDSLGSLDDYHLLSGEGIGESELKDVDKELERMANMGELKEMTSEEFRELMGGDADGGGGADAVGDADGGGNPSASFNPTRKSQQKSLPRFSQMSFLNDDFQLKEDSHFATLASKPSGRRDSHLSLGNMRNSSVFNLSVTDDNGKRWSHNYNSGGNEKFHVSLSRTDNAYDSDLITPSPSKGHSQGGRSGMGGEIGGERSARGSGGRSNARGRRSIDVLEEELDKLKRGFLLNSGGNGHLSDISNEDFPEGGYASDSEFLKRTSLDKKISVDLNFGNDDSLNNSRLSNGSYCPWESRISTSRKMRLHNETPKKGILKQSNSLSPIKELPENVSARKKSVQFSHRSIAVFDDKEKVSPLHLTQFTRISSDSNKSEVKRKSASNDPSSGKEKADTFGEILASRTDKSPIDELLYRYDSLTGAKRTSAGYPVTDGNASNDFFRRISSESVRFKTKTSVDMVHSARLSPIKNRSQGGNAKRSSQLDGDSGKAREQARERERGEDDEEDVLHKLLTTDIDSLKEEDFLKFSLLSDSREFKEFGRVDSGETYERAPSERSKGGVEEGGAEEDAAAQAHLEDRSVQRREGDNSEVFYECNDSAVSVAKRGAAEVADGEGGASRYMVKEERGEERSEQEGEKDDPLDEHKPTTEEPQCKEEEVRGDAQVSTAGGKAPMERLPSDEAVPPTENVTIQYRASSHRRSERAPAEEEKEGGGESGNVKDGDGDASGGGHLEGEAQLSRQSNRPPNWPPNGQSNRHSNGQPNRGGEPSRRLAEGRKATERRTINVGATPAQADDREAQQNGLKVAKANRRASYSVNMHARIDEAQARFRDRKSLNEGGGAAGKGAQEEEAEEVEEANEMNEAEDAERVDRLNRVDSLDRLDPAEEDREAVLRKAELFNRGEGQQHEGEQVRVESAAYGEDGVVGEDHLQLRARGRYTTHIGRGAFARGSSDDLQELSQHARANSDEGNYKKFVYDVGEGFSVEDDLELAAGEEAFRSADMGGHPDGAEGGSHMDGADEGNHPDGADEGHHPDDAEEGSHPDGADEGPPPEQSQRSRREQRQKLQRKLKENLLKKQEMIKQMTLAIVRRCRILSLRELKSNKRNLTNLMQLYECIRDMMFSFVGKINHLNNVSIKLDDAILKYEVTQLRCSRTKKAIETLRKYNGKMETKVKEKKNLLSKQENVLHKKMKKLEAMTEELSQLRSLHNEGSARKQEIHLIDLYKRKTDELRSIQLVKGLVVNSFSKYGINFELLNCSYFNFATLYDYPGEAADGVAVAAGGEATDGVAVGAAAAAMATARDPPPTQEEPPQRLHEISELYERECKLKGNHRRAKRNATLLNNQISEEDMSCAWPYSITIDIIFCNMSKGTVQREADNYMASSPVKIKNMKHLIANKMHLLGGENAGVGATSADASRKYIKLFRPYKIQMNSFDTFKEITLTTYYNYISSDILYFHIWNKRPDRESYSLKVNSLQDDGRAKRRNRVQLLRKHIESYSYYCSDSHVGAEWKLQLEIVKFKLLEVVNRRLQRYTSRGGGTVGGNVSGNVVSGNVGGHLVSGNVGGLLGGHLGGNANEAGSAKPNKEALMYLVEEAEHASVILINLLSQYKHLLKCFLCLSNTFFDYHEPVVIFKTIVLSQQLCPHALWLYLYVNLEEAFTFASLLHGIVQVKVESVDEEDKYSEDCKALNASIVKTLQQCIFALKSKPLDLSERINSYNVVDVIYAVVMNENYNFHSYQNNLDDNLKKLTSCETFINGVVSKSIVVPLEVKK
ncbi:conserved Plasmodium protein, unknown function [Plasmodium vivax]|nr:conserved Plasmodium protein, unknown function [Plasmodium vivax]